MKINRKEFQNALKIVSLAASTDDARPVLQGVYLEMKPDSLTMTCADGFRLTTATLPAIDGETWAGIIPAASLTPLLKVKGESIALTSWDNGTHQETRSYMDRHRVMQKEIINVHIYGLTIDGKEYSCIDGTYPDYHQIIPRQDSAKTTIILPADFQSHASAIAKMAKSFDVSMVARWFVGYDSMTLMTISEQFGSARRDFACPNVQGRAPFAIAVNALFLNDTVRLAKGDITVRMQAKNAPIRIDFENFTTVLMPMYLDGQSDTPPEIVTPQAQATPIYACPAPRPVSDEDMQAWEAHQKANAGGLKMALDALAPATPDSDAIEYEVVTHPVLNKWTPRWGKMVQTPGLAFEVTNAKPAADRRPSKSQLMTALNHERARIRKEYKNLPETRDLYLARLYKAFGNLQRKNWKATIDQAPTLESGAPDFAVLSTTRRLYESVVGFDVTAEFKAIQSVYSNSEGVYNE